MKIYGILVVLFSNLAASWAYQNNVCKKFEAYYGDMDHDPNCWFDRDIRASPDELAKHHGFMLEKHFVNTEDGYILTTFRLKSDRGLDGKKVIFLQHGISVDALVFMVNGNRSIAFFLANQGYDVWLGNFRGTDFSEHRNFSKQDRQFWDFSFHEHGIYDLAVNFEYVVAKTRKKIIYIGHSMGTTSLGIYAAMKPEEAKIYIEHAIFLSPVFYMRSLSSLANDPSGMLIYRLLMLAPITNINVLLATNSFEKQALYRFCFSTLENGRIVYNIFDRLLGNLKNLSIEKLPVSISLVRNICLRELIHYAQVIESGDFKMYDYGSEENTLMYKSSVPPTYPLSKITLPISWVYGEYDRVANKTDVMYTFKKFRKENWDIHGMPYNHMSFFFTNFTEKTLFPLLLKLMNK